ncbi:pyridoxamine 5'-phosphate oxidase family protein [Maribacter sp. 2307ULW6-5]|uniref:pyridoxamine 5'-phosphate oxidase family protein n=1 Tax=Maribacter sp. 2307ULW6-5 TaxID=3386275 RepID=UPI0039BC2FE9
MVRELDIDTCLELLATNYVARMAYVAENGPYMLPVTYLFVKEENICLLCYSGEGHKIAALRKNPRVCFLVDDIKTLTNWRSVTVHGVYEELKGSTAKRELHRFRQGLKKLINAHTEQPVDVIPDFSMKLDVKDAHPVVYRIYVHEIMGKQRRDKGST